MNYVITFGFGTPMKNYAMVFRNKTEDEVRELASTHLRGSWAGIYTEDYYKNAEWSSELTLLESAL